MRPTGITPLQSTCFCILMEFFFCSVIQILWNLDLYVYILITTDLLFLHGNYAFSSETDLVA